jgi:hypothetical protein
MFTGIFRTKEHWRLSKDEETARIGRIRIRKIPDSDPHHDPTFEKRKDSQIRRSLITCILPWPGGKLAATQASYVR